MPPRSQCKGVSIPARNGDAGVEFQRCMPLLTSRDGRQRRFGPAPVARGGARRGRARLGARAQRRLAPRLEAHPDFTAMRERIRAVLDSHDRIPYVHAARRVALQLLAGRAANPRGLWRRTTLDEYRKPEPAWETVLDLDALGRRPKARTGSGRGADCLRPASTGAACVKLSRGGADADGGARVRPREQALRRRRLRAARGQERRRLDRRRHASTSAPTSAPAR